MNNELGASEQLRKQRDRMDKIKIFGILGFYIMVFVSWAAFWGGVIWIVVHFALKYW